MLTTTVAIVRLSQTGMNRSGRFDDVLDTPVEPLEKRGGRKESAAKPSMMTVRISSRRGEDLLPAPCGVP